MQANEFCGAPGQTSFYRALASLLFSLNHLIITFVPMWLVDLILFSCS